MSDPFSGRNRAGSGTSSVVAGAAGSTALVLALLAALPYLLRGGIHTFTNLDDSSYVYENAVVLKGLKAEGVRWAFTTFHASNWHPLTWLSHMADVSLFGTDPWWHHWTSILLHALNSALLFLALRRLSGARWRSAAAAGIFALHPLHVESVAWVSERKDVLSGLCFMLVLLAYEGHVRRGGAVRYGLVAALTALGLMAKPMFVTVPFVLLLVDYWPLGRWRGVSFGVAAGRLVFEKVPLLALAAVSGTVTFAAQSAGGVVRSMEMIPFYSRLVNAVVSYGTYLGKALWPTNLAVYYPHPGTPPPWKVGLALGVLGVVTWAAVRGRRSRPWLLAGWLWFGGMLVPVIGLVQVGWQSMADRYMYLPLVGLATAAVWGAAELGLRRKGRETVLAAAACGTLLVLGFLNYRQAGWWRDSETLFRRTLEVTKDNWLIENNLASLLERHGRREEASQHYLRALRIQPDQEGIHCNLGHLLLGMGQFAEAEMHYQQALRIRPDFPDAHYGLGNLFLGIGRFREAQDCYLKVMDLDPGHVGARLNLGNVLLNSGQPAEAEARYREVLRLEPNHAEAHNNLGYLLEQQGDLVRAVEHYRKALRAQPGFAIARSNLERALRGDR